MSVVGLITSNTSFSEEIDKITRRTGLQYIDAVVHWCEKNNVEVELAATLINKDKVLKAKLQYEAEDLNILKKSARLPL